MKDSDIYFRWEDRKGQSRFQSVKQYTIEGKPYEKESATFMKRADEFLYVQVPSVLGGVYYVQVTAFI